jgi:hypothetical protein
MIPLPSNSRKLIPLHSSAALPAEQIKPKHLAGLSVSVGAEPSGSLKVKSADYSLKTSKTSEAAEELASLHPMLPRKSKNGYLIGLSFGLAPNLPSSIL